MNTDFLAAIERIVEKGGSPKFQKNGAQSKPLAPKSAIRQLKVVPGDQGSHYILSWEETPNSRQYEIQTNKDPSHYRDWQSRLKVMHSNADLELQADEDRLWLRVRAMTSTGPGPWSDPITVGSRLGQFRQAA